MQCAVTQTHHQAMLTIEALTHNHNIPCHSETLHTHTYTTVSAAQLSTQTYNSQSLDTIQIWTDVDGNSVTYSRTVDTALARVMEIFLAKGTCHKSK